jgi:hypothetical protein
VPHRLAAALALGLVLLAPGAGRAQRIDPVTVEVEGRVAGPKGGALPARDALLRAALLEAVVEVTRRSLAPAVFEAQQDAIRAALEPKARSFVLTFRSGPSHQQAALEPGMVEYLQPVAATVDGRRLRSFLAAAGWAPLEATRPSLVLCISPQAGLPPGDEGDAPVERLRRFVAGELEAREFILIEPGVREGAPGCELGALGLARALGADIGIELAVSSRSQPGGGTSPRSAIAEVVLHGQRAVDGSELALGRFEGVGHHDAPSEALTRALEAIQPQVVDNLVLQLGRNWQEIASAVGPIELVLVGVTGLAQVL